MRREPRPHARSGHISRPANVSPTPEISCEAPIWTCLVSCISLFGRPYGRPRSCSTVRLMSFAILRSNVGEMSRPA